MCPGWGGLLKDLIMTEWPNRQDDHRARTDRLGVRSGRQSSELFTPKISAAKVIGLFGFEQMNAAPSVNLGHSSVRLIV
jgi:hypothetical protein